jgi:DNA-binding NtrC family response regulator
MPSPKEPAAMPGNPPKRGTSQPAEVLPGIIGGSRAMLAAAHKVTLIARSDATCLLLGETGTGKELFARSLHYLSARAAQPFVPVNCGAIAEQLFENELFGHVQGAYTDAKAKQTGILAYAEGGTLFLDEVDSLAASAQVKLLRLLQEHEYRPVGASRSIRANVRIVAASNADLRGMVADRRFREDLFHRLDVLRLTIPPLRDREGDISLLAQHFVREYGPGDRAAMEMGSDALALMESHAWPGNVRELQGVLQRAVLMHSGPRLDAESLDLPDPAGCGAAASSHGGVARAGFVGTLKAAKASAIRRFEQQYLAELLESCSGNVSRAARMAGKERRSFQRLLRKHAVGGGSLRA